MSNFHNTSKVDQTVDGNQREVNTEMKIDSSQILKAVLSGDYNCALKYTCAPYESGLSTTIQENLKRVFTAHIGFQQDFQGHDGKVFQLDSSQLDAVIDRFEAVLYDMGDVAEEYNDKNTRIYLTIMAERLVALAQKFDNEFDQQSFEGQPVEPNLLFQLLSKSQLSSDFGHSQYFFPQLESGPPSFIAQKRKMLYVIGLGLSDEKDITVRGLEAVKSCERVYLEAYTSILMVDSAKLSDYYGKQVIVADREMVESESDTILANADNINVAFLVVGDPYGATTHTDLVIRARELNIPVQVIHNASIMNAIGACGLQLYNFGQTISIVFFTDTWRPDSFYDRIKENRELGLHTLCLLDIKVKEQSIENLARGRKIYEPPRYMTVNQAIEQLLEIEDKRGEKAYTSETLAIGCARVGTAEQRLISGTLEQLVDADFGGPLHSLVIIGTKMHELEAEFVKEFAMDKTNFVEIVKRDYA